MGWDVGIYWVDCGAGSGWVVCCAYGGGSSGSAVEFTGLVEGGAEEVCG